MTAIEFHGVDIVFGAATKRALEMVDNGATRDEILTLTGSVLGAAGIDLSVRKGEICVLMGLSGSGKSTILRAVNRLNPVTRGSVLVEHDGAKVDIARCDDATLREVRRRTVSTVFQQFALLPWRTVRDNVGFGLELRGVKPSERNAIIDEKLAMVGLSNWANKKPHELSGGMQQRIGLARAFATNADILLMDEPFSALDPLIRDKLQDELLELQHRLKKTILFVSHDLDEALKLGDNIAILEGGRIVQKGSAEDIYLRPADAYVAEFVKHINPLNVLSLGALMRPAASFAREDRTLLCGRDNHIRVTLDDLGRPVGISVGGEQGQLVACRDEEEPSDVGPKGVLVVSDETELRRAIAWKRLNHHPILGIGPTGELTGICGDGEIYLGLMRRGST
jgi:glycine betaine/proline transport system ATP-binding protein